MYPSPDSTIFLARERSIIVPLVTTPVKTPCWVAKPMISVMSLRTNVSPPASCTLHGPIQLLRSVMTFFQSFVVNSCWLGIRQIAHCWHLMLQRRVTHKMILVGLANPLSWRYDHPCRPRLAIWLKAHPNVLFRLCMDYGFPESVLFTITGLILSPRTVKQRSRDFPALLEHIYGTPPLCQSIISAKKGRRICATLRALSTGCLADSATLKT